MEKDKDRAELYLEYIEDNVRELVVNFSENESQLSQSLVQKGSSLLDLLEAAKSNLGQLDIRTTNEQNFVHAVNSFFDESRNFDAEFNKNKERAVLKVMEKYKEKLFNLLDQEWNSTLALKDGEWIFFRASPLKENTKFICPTCSREYKDARVYQDHLKSAHQITQNVPKPRVTCRLPHTDSLTHTVQWDQITNHLLRVHKIPKPSKLHFFRGFESQEGGANCKVVWRKRDEQDPEPPSQKNAAVVDSVAGSSTSNIQEADLDPPGDSVAGSSTSNIQEADLDPSASVAGPFVSDSAEAMNQDLKESSQQIAGESYTNAQTIEPSVLNNQEDVGEVELPRADELNRDTCAKQLFPENNNFKEASVPSSSYQLLPSEKVSSNDEESKPSGEEIEPEKSKPSAVIEKRAKESAEGFQGRSGTLDISDEVWTGPEVDSDVEPDDSAEFTQMRLANKKKRYKAREEVISVEEEPALLPENQAFIEEFRCFVSKKGVSDNPDQNTFKKSDGILFRHDDSWLKFMMKKKHGFKLNDLLKFDKKDEFVELKDPQSWLDTIAGPTGNDEPSRQREFLKSHKQLRDFVARKLSDCDLGGDFQELWWQEKIQKNLDQITKNISDRGLFGKLADLIKIEFTERQISREVLCPNKNINEVKANSVYFSSKEFLAREAKNNAVWKKATETNSINDKDYNEFFNFSRHVLAFTDRCRQGVYQFNNQDFYNKKNCWFPDDFTEKEFQSLPDNHAIFQEPDDKRPPDMWLIRLSGSGSQIKMKSGTAVTVNNRALDLMTKCRDLKDIVHGKLDPKAPFFCKYDGKNFGQLVNKKGSMMAEFGEVAGVDWCTQTSLRRSLEKPIQSNEAMKTRSKTVAQHSSSVGSKFYDRTAPEFRAAAMHHIGSQDGSDLPASQKRGHEKISDELASKRARIEKEDNAAKIKSALENVQKSKKRNVKLGKSCKVLPENREFLQIELSKGGRYEQFLAGYDKFPKEAVFRKIYYRIIDTLDDEDDLKEKMLRIESKIYQAIIGEFEDETNRDTQNKLADRRIAKAIFTSFRVFESGRKKFDKSYFKFK